MGLAVWVEREPASRSTPMPSLRRRVQRSPSSSPCGCAGTCDDCAGHGKAAAPPSIHQAVGRPGRPLPGEVRTTMERRLGHDFSRVRIHADSAAATSADEVGADAYTVGSHVVFAQGRYAPTTPPGERLLAHELAHVVQQGSPPPSAALPADLEVGAPDGPGEHEAERGSTPTTTVGRPKVMRALRVRDPANPIPNPTGTGLNITNAESFERDLQALAPQARPTVNRTTGIVEFPPEMCTRRGWLSRFGRGIVSGAKTGAGIGVFAGIVGAIPGAILGGLIGGIAGIIGGADSNAEETSTPTSASCLCDFANDPRDTWLVTDDTSDNPHAGRYEVHIPSPNGRRFGAATAAGERLEQPRFVVLGHELCGHTWLLRRGEEDSSEHDATYARDRPTVERENRIRAEHGIPLRGTRIKDPYCGESFYREPTDPPGTVNWTRQTGSPTTMLEECQQAREQFLGDDARRYRVDQRIP